MKCSELQPNLSLYADGLLDESASTALRSHLEVCPLCRQTEADLRVIRTGLRRIVRPEIPASLRASISRSVDRERERRNESWRPFRSDLVDRIRLGFAPYGIGVAASLVVGFTFLAMMFTRMGDTGGSPFASSDERFLLARNSGSYSNSGDNIWPADYARARTEFASESPSINPQGALVAITKSLVRGDMKDDELVVVADVFSNGVAQIAEVVEPSRDRRVVDELEKALQSDPAFSPFLPTTLENRPDSVRVVLKFQSVNVSTGTKRVRARL